ncbi:putative 1-phosphatidylinositol 4,5-bisphosphate phosphodiesterase beta-4 isoform X5 [Apostichopus japonicus]|uniref:Putative 1-phosphatidylinositol 4,5-bisphosphate phosphodiesterase beta-4 isoform X5 n=1 Tax=Stichopus japonicus TaxID=307972 RepID=A0A2G8LRE2_STIJA|nr:putative 1-phosphatidylinositol 4,5-bisphosphate phosphodiesterase beta-4 isoform X5 [Apostichopus japonicus]
MLYIDISCAIISKVLDVLVLYSGTTFRKILYHYAHPELKNANFDDLKDGIKSPIIRETHGEPLSQEAEAEVVANYRYVGATTNIHPYLSKMINYAQPVKFQNFETSEELNLHFQMSSFNESVGLGYIKQQCIEFVKYPYKIQTNLYNFQHYF